MTESGGSLRSDATNETLLAADVTTDELINVDFSISGSTDLSLASDSGQLVLFREGGLYVSLFIMLYDFFTFTFCCHRLAGISNIHLTSPKTLILKKRLFYSWVKAVKSFYRVGLVKYVDCIFLAVRI